MSTSIYKKLNAARLRSILVVLAIALASLVLFQNCSVGLQSAASPSTNNPSPFDNPNTSRDGILLTPGLVSLMSSVGGVASVQKLTGQEVIPVNTKLAFIVDDACIKERISGPLNRYFLDKYLDKNMELTPDAKFNQSLVMVTLSAALTFDQLVKIKRGDSCIVGIANDQGIKYKISQAGSALNTGRSQQTYLNQMNYDKSFYDDNTDSASVKVAVIDTGYDLARGVPINLIETDFLVGTNYIENSNTPQDKVGHGTNIISLIAAKPSSNSAFTGVASKAAQVLPLKAVGDDGAMSIGLLFKAMKHAVNAGAEVINISLGAAVGVPPAERKPGMEISCDPIFGQSLFEAVENGAVVVMSAGNFVYQDPTTKKTYPGSIYSPKDNSTENLFDFNFVPACWARYYKGVIAVAALDKNGQISAQSNWGADAVEMAAPGDQIVAAGLDAQLNTLTGTSFATPLVSGAVVNIMAYFKKKGWSYNPWIIEDTLINGTGTSPQLWGEGVEKKVRLGKSLNFRTLQDYLVSLNSKTDAERRSQPSDNPESGVGLNRGIATEGRYPIKLEVYTKELFINVKSQSQIQAVLYYNDASTEVVTDQVTWSSDNASKLEVTATGMAYPKSTGNFKVTAQHANNMTATADVRVVDYNTWSGSRGQISNLKVTGFLGPAGFPMVNGISVSASYTDGRFRVINDYTRIVYRTLPNGQMITENYKPSTADGERFWVGGAEYTIVVLYRGFRVEKKYRLPKWEIYDRAVRVSSVTRNADSYMACDFKMRWIPGTGDPAFDSQTFKASDFSPFEYAVFETGYPNSISAGFQRSSRDLFDMTGGIHRLGGTFVADDQSPAQGVASCMWHEWGSGAYSRISFSKNFDVVASKAIAVKFKKSAFGISSQLSSTGTADDIKSLTGSFALWRPSHPSGLELVPYVLYENGSQKAISDTSTFSVKDSSGQVNELNWAEPSKISRERINVNIFAGKPGQTFNLIVTDSVTGLAGTLPITIGGSFPRPTNTFKTINLPQIEPLPAKSTDAFCNDKMNLAPFAGGSGTLSDPLLICSKEQFLKISSQTRSFSYKLLNNINLEGVSMNDFPIRFKHTDVNFPRQPASFFGNGYQISNVAMADAEKTVSLFYVELMGRLDSIEDLNLASIVMRGRSVSTLVVTEGYNNLTIKNTHIDNAYIEGSVRLYGFAERFSAENISIRNLQMKLNPGNGSGAAFGLGGDIVVKNAQIHLNVISTPGASVAAVAERGNIENVSVSGELRGVAGGGVLSGMLIGGTIKNSKSTVNITGPGASVVAFTSYDFNSAAYTNENYVSINNAHYEGNITTGSEFEGGSFAPVGGCSICNINAMYVKANINARTVSGLSTVAFMPNFSNNTIDINLVNVPTDAQVARFFNQREGVKNAPIFTILTNNNITIRGASAPDILKDANGQPANNVVSLEP